jgi:hypothetical protein
MRRTNYFTRDEIRADLQQAGLAESERPIDGRAFTFTTSGRAALERFRLANFGIPATSYYVDHHMFILNALNAIDQDN